MRRKRLVSKCELKTVSGIKYVVKRGEEVKMWTWTEERVRQPVLAEKRSAWGRQQRTPGRDPVVRETRAGSSYTPRPRLRHGQLAQSRNCPSETKLLLATRPFC